VPDYTGLKIVGWLCIVVGFVCFLLGATWILVVMTLAVIGGGAAARDEPAAAGALVMFSGLYSLVTAMAVFLVGIVQVAFGQLLLAIRDMARNSFWLRRM
jgi:hypothetical protein